MSRRVTAVPALIFDMGVVNTRGGYPKEDRHMDPVKEGLTFL